MIYHHLLFNSPSLLLLGLVATAAAADIVLTGCHVENGLEVCFLNGVKTTFTDAATPTPTSPANVVAATTTAAQTTAITDCHQHGTTQYCVKGNGEEVQVLATATGTAALPTAYTGCHAHGATELYCMTEDGGEVQVLGSAEEEGHEEGHADETGDAAAGEEENCHFHAGVEHCGSHGAEANALDPDRCERKDRDYNRKLRIGLIFAVLATSYAACISPLLMTRTFKVKLDGTFFTVVKQFGTGIIISTALVHLTTHAQLMFGNSCVGELAYEGTTTAVIMAGMFIAFLVDFVGHRMAVWRQKVVAAREAPPSIHSDSPASEAAEKPMSTTPEIRDLAMLSHHHDVSHGPAQNDVMSVLVLEAGILFHSILIGITLVVAGDSVFITLFIVILFHQMFEGLALGARIAAIDKLSRLQAILMPLAFGLITPIGMAIGIAVLDKFNGNDRSTIIAIGTLDAVSAGILLWVGTVSMLVHDWMYGDLRDAGFVKTSAGMASLVSGMVVMSVLGKWA